MGTKAMVVLAGGMSSRFGSDKLARVVAGRPLIAHTVAAASLGVDLCVLVGRPERVEWLRSLGLGVRVAAGGETRTVSEMAGLAALGEPADLIAIHDGARPLLTSGLIEAVFAAAAQFGGAIPAIDAPTMLIERATFRPVQGVRLAQTPQAFRGPELMAAYVRAARSGFEGRDTAEVMERFGELPVATVEGDPGNIKVTYPSDLAKVRRRLTAPSRSEPR